MIRKFIVAGAAILASSAAAYADGPAGQSFEITGEYSRSVSFADDGSYTVTMGGETSSGSWHMQDGQLCVHNPSSGADACADWNPMGLGDSITSTDYSPDGSEETITRTE